MTFKNGFKEYFGSGLIFGVLMGIFFGIMYLNPIAGLAGGLMTGGLFGFFIFIFCKIQEKKFDKIRAEITSQKRVICDGGATYQGNGGWLFFTEEGLEFIPHKFNFSRDRMVIPMNMIRSVDIKRNSIVVGTTAAVSFPILVSHGKEWKQIIESNLPADSI